jgi:hypothetical protein
MASAEMFVPAMPLLALVQVTPPSTLLNTPRSPLA